MCEMNERDFLPVVHSRRSVRTFRPDPVPREALERILEVGRRAASAANRQPWHFVVAEKSAGHPLHRLLEGRSQVDAPVLIMGLADRRPAWVRKGDGINYAWVDTTIALTEMILAATAEGLGTCWVAAFDPAEARRLLKLPSEVDPVAPGRPRVFRGAAGAAREGPPPVRRASLAGAATSPSRRPLPPSFREIQSRRRRASRILFALLLLFYFAAFQVLWLTLKAFFSVHIVVVLRHPWLTWRDLAMVGSISVIAAALHWWGAMCGGTERILDALGARPLDPDDRFHRQLENVVREMEIAAGTAATEIRVINHTSLNAFAVTDPSGRSTVGVTEGLLAALDRNRLQAVIAHEMTHIREGDTLLATMACSLFGVFAQMLESLRSVKNRDEREARLDLHGARPLADHPRGLPAERRHLAAARVAGRRRRGGADPQPAGAGRGAACHGAARGGPSAPGAGVAVHRLARRRPAGRAGRAPGRPVLHPPAAAPPDHGPCCGWPGSGYGSFDERMRTEDADGGRRAPRWSSRGGRCGQRDAGDPAAGPARRPPTMASWSANSPPAAGAPKGKGRATVPRAAGICASATMRGSPSASAPRAAASCSATGRTTGSCRAVRSGSATTCTSWPSRSRSEHAFRRRTDVENGVPSRRCPDCGDPMRGQHYSYQFFLRVDRCARCRLTWFDPYELELLQIMVERPRPSLLPTADGD